MRLLEKSKKALKLLFVKPCLRPGGFTKLLPVGLACVMTYFETKGYDFTLLDIDIDEYDDEYVENYIKNNHFDIILTGTIVTHYKWIKWFVNMTKKHQPTSKIVVGNSVAGSIPEVFDVSLFRFSYSLQISEIRKVQTEGMKNAGYINSRHLVQ